MIFEINKIIKNIKFPKILLFKDLFYIYGINSIKVSKILINLLYSLINMIKTLILKKES